MSATVTRAEFDAFRGELLGEVKKTLSPVQEAVGKLAAPARAQGLSPAALMNQLVTADQSVTVGPNGYSVVRHDQLRRRKGIGYQVEKSRTGRPLGREPMAGDFGDYLTALYKHHPRTFQAGLSTQKERQEAQEKLDAWGVKALVEGRDGAVEKTALAESSGVTGGYTVPPMFYDELMRYQIEQSIIRPRARTIPLTARTLLFPVLDQATSAGAGNSSFLAGVQATWVAEAATRSESEPAFRQMELTAWELSFISIASNTLLADSAVGLDALLTELFGMAIAWYSDYAFFQGNGVGKPLGILNCPCTLQVTREASGNFTFYDALNMYAKLYAGLWKNNCFWAMHQSVMPRLARMNDDSGTSQTGRLVWLPYNEGAKGKLEHPDGPWSAGELLGFPVYVTEKLPALGTLGCVLLVDGGSYFVGERMDLQIDVSPHYRFATNQLTWRVVARMDGQPWLSGAITLADGTQTVSPFVTLTQ